MNKEALHRLAAESLNEGLRLDDWDKIGCVNHDCDQCKAQQDIPDLIAGALGVSRGTAYDMMREALAEQTAQQEPVKWSGYELDGRRYKTMEERLKDAFYEGFTSSATYNDIELNDVDEEWLKYAADHGITKGELK